jgi:hypothetical protein
MNEVEMRQQLAVRNAVITQLHSCGLKPLEGSEGAILDWFNSKNVTASAPNGYLVLEKSDGGAVVPSSACETLRKELPLLFVPDPRRDAVSSRQDLERGTPQEISQAKSQFISKNGLPAFEALPKTRAEAERKAVAPSPDMTRSEYLSLSFSDKARLAGIVKADGIAKIMSRRG